MSAEWMMGPALAVVAGIGAAQLTGPLTLGWPGRGQELLKRVAALTWKRPGPAARAVGAGLIGLLLVSGALAAYAAAPAAPRRLVRQAVQVAGLEVRDAFMGDRAMPAAPPESAKVDRASPDGAAHMSVDDALVAEAIAKGAWDGKAPQPGLTLDETRELLVMEQKLPSLLAAWKGDILARAAKAGLPTPQAGISVSDLGALLGPDAPRYAELNNRRVTGRDEAAAAAYDRYGPVTVHVASEADRAAVIAPYDGARWSLPANRQADGGYDLTMSRPSATPSLLLAKADPTLPQYMMYPTGIDANGRLTYTGGPLPPPL